MYFHPLALERTVPLSSCSWGSGSWGDMRGYGFFNLLQTSDPDTQGGRIPLYRRLSAVVVYDVNRADIRPGRGCSSTLLAAANWICIEVCFGGKQLQLPARLLRVYGSSGFDSVDFCIWDYIYVYILCYMLRLLLFDFCTAPDKWLLWRALIGALKLKSLPP